MLLTLIKAHCTHELKCHTVPHKYAEHVPIKNNHVSMRESEY